MDDAKDSLERARKWLAKFATIEGVRYAHAEGAAISLAQLLDEVRADERAECERIARECHIPKPVDDSRRVQVSRDSIADAIHSRGER